MRFTVLGPVRAWRGETELQPGPPKRRALLALLLARAGEPVPIHEIVDVLWGENASAGSVNAVHRHVGALRRLLDTDPSGHTTPSRLVRGSGGYRLILAAGELDLQRFRALRDEARAARDLGDPARAAASLIEALALWRGPTASGIAPEVRAHPAFAAVDREHPAAVKEAAAAALEAGPALARQMLPILRQTAAAHPLDEVLHASLVTALAVTGHRAEARKAYRDITTRLVDELSLDPGPELRAAEAQLPRSTASTPPGGPETGNSARSGAEPEPPQLPYGEVPDTEASTKGTGPADGTTRKRPVQLPPDLSMFTGRSAELRRVHALLSPSDDRPNTVVISAIGGMAGVGKTSLAVHWAHQIADRFPDGQLYADLRGFDRSGSVADPAEVIRGFLDALGVPAHRIPVGLDAQAALYRTLLAGHRVLVLLDNARDTEQVRPLLPGSAGCLIVVTSRNHLHGLVVADGAHPLSLDLLTAAESREFLVRRLGTRRVAEEPAAADEIVALCGSLPLTLALVTARAAARPDRSLSSVAGELRETRGSLAAFTHDDGAPDPRTAFSWSYDALTPGAARLFRLLALHPGPDASTATAAVLLRLPLKDTRPLLAELVGAHLLTQRSPGRFGSHELLRIYAGELTESYDTPEERNAARHRLLDHLLHTAHRADSLLAPHRERLTLSSPVAPVASPTAFDSAEEAASWLTAQSPVLLAAVLEAARSGFGTHCWQLAATLELFLDRHGRWQDQLVVQEAALHAAEELGDLSGRAHAHRALGFVHGRLEHPAEAHEHLSTALELFAATGDAPGQGRVHRYLAFQANRQGLHHVALDHYRQAYALYEAAGHRSGQAGIHNEVGWTRILLGAYEEALADCRRAIAMNQELGDRNGEAAAWDSLGYAHHHLGQYQQALICYEHALTAYREIHDDYLEADTLVHIGDAWEADGSQERAADAWRQALRILETIAHPDAEHVRDKLRTLASHDGTPRRQSAVESTVT
ncbi:BTAD domain-containing putative transcriptional regulator [Streptomyces sp. NPDC057253]|uniref:AfsR/SARP family transcriptional regulator n=1 Tax=Streptomyces sp. NPDC057253 TaxID=3346069 RepID=UPI00362CCC5F